MTEKSDIRCTSCTSELKRIRQRVRQHCEQVGMDRRRADAVVLAIDEACANIIRHGYQYANTGLICIDIYQQDHDLVFLIKDHCPQLSPQTLKPGKQDPLTPGGLGLKLIHNVMDSVALIPHGGSGNWLELKVTIKDSE